MFRSSFFFFSEEDGPSSNLTPVVSSVSIGAWFRVSSLGTRKARFVLIWAGPAAGQVVFVAQLAHQY